MTISSSLCLVWLVIFQMTPAYSAPPCNCDASGTGTFINKDLMTVPDNIDPDTQCLIVTKNIIQELPNNVFFERNLVKLQCVKFTHNFLHTVQTKAFFGLSKLAVLDLSGNNLTHVYRGTFLWNPMLAYLHLGDNNLKKFPHLHLENLEVLDLRNNNIEEIASGALSGIPKLTTLLLQQNNLKAFPWSFLETLKSIQILSLRMNPALQCEPWMDDIISTDSTEGPEECIDSDVNGREVCIGLDYCVSLSSITSQRSSEILTTLAVSTYIFSRVRSTNRPPKHSKGQDSVRLNSVSTPASKKPIVKPNRTLFVSVWVVVAAIMMTILIVSLLVYQKQRWRVSAYNYNEVNLVT